MLLEYTPDAQRKAGRLGRNEHLAQSWRALLKYVLKGSAAEPEGTGVDRCWPRDGSSFKTPSLWPFSPLLFIDELQRELTLLLFGLEW